jgi:hypothetical protein
LIEKIWKEESSRNDTLALGSILSKQKIYEILSSIFESKLLHHVDHAENGFLSMLRNDRLDELVQMSAFFRTHFPGGVGLNRMGSMLRDHILQLGNDLLFIRDSNLSSSRLSHSDSSSQSVRVPERSVVSEKQRESVDMQYVKDLISLNEKYLSSA